MPDVLDPVQRARCMRANRGRDTKPERMLRSALWRKGRRYRIKNRLPGRPDIVFSSLHVAVFVDGCFWHGCPEHFQQPKTNADFWRQKISSNMDRDVKNTARLEAMGWMVVRCWEHEIRQDVDACAERVVALLTERQYRSG